MRSIDKIILHCSANGPNSTIGAKEIREYHMRPVAQGGRGWSDIGYHYVIRRDGTLDVGRDIAKAGAHCTGLNAHSVGICLVGGVKADGKTPEDNFLPEQFDTLAKLLRNMRLRFPNASIHGHNEFAQKACPVFNVGAFLAKYGISKLPEGDGWDAKRWPHFKAKEFTNLWGEGSMPQEWKDTLDRLEKLRSSWGRPLVIKWNTTGPLHVAISISSRDHERFIALAKNAGFSYAAGMADSNAVAVGSL